ncbi:hypothetical protein NKI44_16460 [Mesorhizobium sp. M0614]|uniref:hypothetical protein n=1 Tax=Mesorhizobium sp. M0614 TaxID=2956970 RepID=UPI00333A3F0A
MTTSAGQKPSLMDFARAKTLLAARLRKLDATGTSGFEGLMRDVLSETTGQLFRLAKSGPQAGSDVRTIEHNTFRVGLEAKRYGAKTRLSLDQMKAKVVDSALQSDPVDLWILAASREIPVTDIEALRDIGNRLGVAVLVLDWPSHKDSLPDLAVLCLEAPVAMASHFGNDRSLRDVVRAIGSHPDFAKSRERVRQRLLDADIGYAAAVSAMKTWIEVGLSNPMNAASRLGGSFNNLHDPAVRKVLRPSLNEQLDKWLISGRPAVLLGDEGMGKTWSFLSWWAANSADGRNLPLSVFVSANDVRDDNAEELLAKVLARRLGHGDATFWLRRVGLWQRADFAGQQFILVVDGLNQNWRKRDWSDFLQPLYDERWKGRFAVLTSCWPDHWADLHRLAPLAPRPDEIRVGPFSNDELKALLKLHAVEGEAFGDRMLDLMKVPRLSQLAIERREALAPTGDITPERLAYEDWKHRVGRRGAALAISDEEFRDFIRDLGSGVKVSLDDAMFTRVDLVTKLGRESGKGQDDLRETVAELIAGRWLEAGDGPHRFKLRKELTPFVLGLILAAELRGLGDEGEAAAIIATFVDPYKGQRLGVSILRATATIALLDGLVGRPARRAIVHRWVAEQNFSQVDYDAFWRLIGLDFELFCQIAEETWLARSGNRSMDEILIKGLARAHSFAEIAPRLVRQVTIWLGWLWADPDDGRFLGKIDPNSERSVTNRKRTHDNLKRWNDSPISSTCPTVELVATGDVSWLAHRVFGILSFLPLQAFTDAFLAWAISRAIMATANHFEELAWVLRLGGGKSGDFHAALLKAVDELTATGDDIALTGGQWLLEALGDAVAGTHLAALVKDKSPTLFADRADTQSPLDPNACVANHDAKFAGDQLWLLGRQSSDDDNRFERLKAMLARTDPNLLQQIVRLAALSAPGRNELELQRLVAEANRLSLLYRQEERLLIADAIKDLIDASAIAKDDDLPWWRARELELRLWDLEPEQLLDRVLDDCLKLPILARIEKVLLRCGQSAIRSRLSRFPLTGPRDDVLSGLLLLGAIADEEALDGWSDLAPLVSSVDAEIRGAAFELAPETRDTQVLQAIADSGWKAAEANNLKDRCRGSLALLAASEILQRPELMEEADPEIWAVMLQRNPEDPVALQKYHDFVRGAFDRLDQKGGSWSYPRYWANHDLPMTILIARQGASLVAWLNAWLDERNHISNVDTLDEFPLIALCEGLIRSLPAAGIPLWRKLNDARDRGIIKNPRITLLAVEAPACAAGDEGRREALDLCTTDNVLLDMARAAIQHGQSSWLEATIRDDEASGDAARIARAYTLLGFCDLTPAFEKIWTEFEARKPRTGWLAEVYATGSDHYRRNRWAREWYRRYLHAADQATAFAAHEVLAKTIDGRGNLWIKGKDIELLTTPVGRHWDTNLTVLNQAIKSRSETLQDKLYGARIMRQTQSPWL